jgi:hypothetical protein
MQDFQELADEAFRDLPRKYGRPTDLRGRGGPEGRRVGKVGDDGRARLVPPQRSAVRLFDHKNEAAVLGVAPGPRRTG